MDYQRLPYPFGQACVVHKQFLLQFYVSSAQPVDAAFAYGDDALVGRDSFNHRPQLCGFGASPGMHTRAETSGRRQRQCIRLDIDYGLVTGFRIMGMRICKVHGTGS